MIKYLILAFLLVGCGTTSVTEVTNVEMGENGTYINNDNGTITYVDYPIENPPEMGIYNASYDKIDCLRAGYSWCDLTNTCMSVRIGSGTCTN